VTLRQVDVNDQAVELFIDPGKNVTVPPDSIIVDLSIKRMIWLVWAGTVLIALGGAVTLVQRTRKG
jgi:cytochrome c biogenesis factor